MSSNKTVFFLIGILLTILGFSMLIPYTMQLLQQENSHSFIASSFITIFIGILFILSNLEKQFKLNLQQTFLFSALAWLMIAAFGSLPFLLSPVQFSISEAFFESMSGITTTGATVITNLDSTPKSILLWRAIMQWLGGIGIIVMAITILPLLKVGGMQLFKMEGPLSTEKILPRTLEVATILIITYLVLTSLCAFFYWLFGMSVFDSIAHSMTTLATGGFSTHNDSIGFFGSSNIEIVASIFIILGSIPFIAYLKFLKGNRKIFLEDIQIKGLINILCLSILIMFIYLFLISDETSALDNFRISFFNVISILSGTGYVTDDFGLWGKFSLIFFLFLMFIGGCAGSTACGIKIFRLQMLLMFLKSQVKRIISPNSVAVISTIDNPPPKWELPAPAFKAISRTFFLILKAIACNLSITLALDIITSLHQLLKLDLSYMSSYLMQEIELNLQFLQAYQLF